MPTPISMFKAADGKIFENMASAIAYEQSLFIRESLTPLLRILLHAVCSASHDTPEAMADVAVDFLVNDRKHAIELQKAFAKLQLTPNVPVKRKRAKKKAKPTPPTTADPAVPEPSAPTEDYMGGIDALAGATPIPLPGDQEQAPPPPQA